jgi:hypothetical protein
MPAACAGPSISEQNHRIRLETDAILTILKRCTSGWEMIESTAVLFEINLISDVQREKYVRDLAGRPHIPLVLVQGLIKLMSQAGHFPSGISPVLIS